MKREVNLKKLAIAGVLTAVAVAGSLFSFPVLGSRCSPVQHMVNVICAVFLGPGSGGGAAFAARLLRNLLALGSPLAFPGSMCGALLCGLAYRWSKSLSAACGAEVFGTGILGGLLAWPVAVLVMGKAAGDVAFYTYMVPFLVSTAGGALIACGVLAALKRAGGLRLMQEILEH